MTQALIKYEAALTALAECRSVDEVKGWADKAAAMQAYGRMAQDRSLEVDAAEIRIRAERRLGELIAAQKAGPGLNKGGNPNLPTGRDRRPVAPTLADAGISKDLSSRAQKLAAVPAAEFEAELAAKRERDKADGARVSARLERAGERELKKRQPAEDQSDMQSAQEVAEDLLAENEKLRAEIKAMSADDLKAEALKWRRIADAAQRAQSDAMDRAAKTVEREAWTKRQLMRCGKAIGEGDPDRIAAAVEAFVRRHRVVA